MARWIVYLISAGLIVLASALWMIDVFLPPDELLSPDTRFGLNLIGVLLALMGAAGVLFNARLARGLHALLNEARQLYTESFAGWQYQWRQTPRWMWGLLVLWVIAGTGLRLRFITQPIRTDEAWTTFTYALKPLYLALSDYSAPNNHLFHTFWVFLSTRLFGLDEWAVRLPAFTAGVLMIPMTYIVLRALYSAHAGIIAAGFVAVSAPLIEYSTNARGYTLQTLLILSAILLAHHTIQNRNSVVRWLLLAVTSALTIYTIPTGIYAMGGIWLWLLLALWMKPDRENLTWIVPRVFGYGLLSVGMILILYAPVLIVSGLSSITGNTYVSGLEFSQFVEGSVEMLGRTLTQWHTDIPLPVVIALLIGIGLALLLHRRLSDDPLPLVLPLLVSILALLLLQQVTPFRRVWLFLLPLYFGMGAAGWLALAQPRIRFRQGIVALASVAILVIGVTVTITRSPYTSPETGTFRDAEAVILDLAPRLQGDARIVYEHPSGESMMFYMVRHGIDRFYLSREGVSLANPIYIVVNQEYPQTVESVLRVNSLPRDAYGVAQRIGVYPQAEVYRLDPLNR